ncbi:MAG: 50S ribosomal protein L11 methyltransferase [Acidimicrobiales bacterium]
MTDTPPVRNVPSIGPDLFGSHEIAFECLADLDRTERLVAAVASAVGPGDRVLELGTGTGILSLAAARAGASAVDAYELSPDTVSMARRNIAANGFASVVQVIEEDVTTARFSGPYDVVIAELISVGLVEELLVPAFDNLFAQGVLAPDVRVIPTAQSTYVELVDADFEFFGFELPMIQIEQTWQPRRVRAALTEPHLVSDPDFTGSARLGASVSDQVVAVLDLPAVASGRVNALRITSVSHLGSGIDSGWTQCMNSPAIVPIEARDVDEGTPLAIDLDYRMGSGFSSLRFAWRGDTRPTRKRA